jgi:hypothetical protein
LSNPHCVAVRRPKALQPARKGDPVGCVLRMEGVTMAEQSRYDGIGGVNALSIVVDRFSDQIVKNPKLNLNPALKEWNE